MTPEKQSDLTSRLLAAAKHLKVCDRQSNYIKVQCDKCEEAHSIIADAENFICGQRPAASGVGYITIAIGKRWHLWVSRCQWAWFELWASWDCHNYTLSVTILTVEIGWEWVWVKSRDTLKKGGRQIMWPRVP